MNAFLFPATSTPCPDADPNDPDAPPCLKMEPEVGTIMPSAGQQSSHNCPPGLDFHDGIGQCLDVNECNRGLHSCQARQKCINTVGSYKCVDEVAVPTEERQQGCPSGFQFDQRSGRCEGQPLPPP